MNRWETRWRNGNFFAEELNGNSRTENKIFKIKNSLDELIIEWILEKKRSVNLKIDQ